MEFKYYIKELGNIDKKFIEGLINFNEMNLAINQLVEYSTRDIDISCGECDILILIRSLAENTGNT
jgi:hypothetical protein